MAPSSTRANVLRVSRKPNVPPELAARPFTLDEARAAGITLSALRGRAWKRLAAELYCWTGSEPDPWHVLAACRRRLPSSIVFAGKTAAWMLGLDFDPIDSVEVIAPLDSALRSQAGVVVRRGCIDTRDLIRVRGLPATTLTRTLFDICAHDSPVEALVAIDMAIQRGLTDRVALTRYAAESSGRAGAARLRFLASLGEPAESPMETRLRWLLIQAGLPRPQVQVDVRDSTGRFLGRADLFYRSANLIIEFDGGNHRERLIADDRRQNVLTNAGYRLLRFTGADVFGRPEVVIAQVRCALGEIGDNAFLVPKARIAAAPSARLAPEVRNRRTRRANLSGRSWTTSRS